MIQSSEMPLNELLSVGSVGELLDRSGRSAHLFWTPLGVASHWVLNMLPPAGHVFWSFGDYMAFGRGHASVLNQFIKAKAALSTLSRIASSGSGDGRSFSAHVLLGGCSRFFGDRLIPDELDEEFFVLAQRHSSFMVPHDAKARVESHFLAQARSFGSAAFKRAPDDEVIIASSPFPPAIDLALTRPLDLMGQKELDHVLGITRSWSGSDDARLFASPVGRALGARGGIKIGLQRPVREGVDAESLVEVARFRVEVCMRMCSLRVIEQLLTWELDMPGWRDEKTRAAAHELRAMLGQILHKVPVISEDPFRMDAP